MSNGIELDFASDGYVMAVGNSTALERIRGIVAKAILAELPRARINGVPELNQTLDYLHKLNLSPTELNELRIAAIKRLAEQDVNELVFTAFKSVIVGLLGPDLLIQKNTNLVIQVPNDPNPSELHRDAPPNSEYELVAWVPLVNVDEDMAMYILGLSESKLAKRQLHHATSWAEFRTVHARTSTALPIDFGKGLFFWTGLFHGSEVNRGTRTRVSLNIRFKAIGTPFGSKAATQFFRVLAISPLTRMGLESEIEN